MSYTPYIWEPGEIITAEKLNNLEMNIEYAIASGGHPNAASTKAAMSDINMVYVYTGNESGMTNGNWYYYNGSDWVSGGVYNAVAVQTDKTLTVENSPADAKAAGMVKADSIIVTVDASSTATAYNATISGITAYKDGLTFLLYNNKISSNNNCTLNLNGLGARPIYNSSFIRVTREFMIDTVIRMTYSTSLVSGGCWIMSDNPLITTGTGQRSLMMNNPDAPNTASAQCAMAFGANTTASGRYSLAFGTHTSSLSSPVASGAYAVAIGPGTTASGGCGVAIGQGNTASGAVSYALGNRTTASGNRSLAVGEYTIAASLGQTAIGQYNISDSNNKYAFIIGNGTADGSRSNAATVDWDGNGSFFGGVSVGEKSYLSFGDTIVNRRSLSCNLAEYNIVMPYSSFERGTIDTEDDEGTNMSSTTKIRSTSFIPLEAGDEIRLLRSDISAMVVSYTSASVSSYRGMTNVYTETSYVANKGEYVKIVTGYTDNRTIANTEAAFNGVLPGIALIRKSSRAKSFTDDFEFGGLSASTSEGVLDNANDYMKHRSCHMYDISGSNYVGITFNGDDVSSISKVNFNFYTPDFSTISVVGGVVKNGDRNLSAPVPSGYQYVMIEVVHGSTTKIFRAASVFADVYIERVFLPNRGNTSSYDAIPFNYRVFGDIMTSGRLLLPPNYSMTGNKVPLIVWVHGSRAIVTWNDTLRPHQTSSGEAVDYSPFYNYMINEGFAVFDCYPWTNKFPYTTEMWSPFQMPLNERAYIEGIKYVCNHFNVDIDNVSLLCKSQGGSIGHWAYMQTEFKFRAVGLFAPSHDPVQTSGGMFYGSVMRKALFDHYDLVGTSEEISAFKSNGNPTNALVESFLRKNKGVIVSLSPYAYGIHGSGLVGGITIDELLEGAIFTTDETPEWMLAEGLPSRESTWDHIALFAKHDNYAKTAQCPVKFWCAFDDASVSAYGNYAIHRYLQNGGSDSEFRVLPNGTGGHAALDTSPLALKSSGTTALGIAYSNVPTAFVEFVAFISKYVR